MKIGDIVIFKDQSKMLYKGAVLGGVVLLITDTVVVLQRHHRAPTTYDVSELRTIEATDLPERGIEIV